MRHLLLLALFYPSASFAESDLHRVSIAADPINWINGTYALSASYVLSDHVALRADGQVSGSMPDWRTSISAPIYLDRAFHGPFIEPGVLVRAASSPGIGTLGGMGSASGIGSFGGTVGGLTGGDHSHAVGPQIFVGWQRTFGSGLNIAGAIGASRTSPLDQTAAMAVKESYLRLGYAF